MSPDDLGPWRPGPACRCPGTAGPLGPVVLQELDLARGQAGPARGHHREALCRPVESVQDAFHQDDRLRPPVPAQAHQALILGQAYTRLVFRLQVVLDGPADQARGPAGLISPQAGQAVACPEAACQQARVFDLRAIIARLAESRPEPLLAAHVGSQLHIRDLLAGVSGLSTAHRLSSDWSHSTNRA